jgi:hypothetical protein
MDAQLIDKIYESCFTPEVWPEVLDQMGRIVGSPGATLVVSKNDVLHWAASPEPRARAERFVKEGWLWRGTIIAKLFGLLDERRDRDCRVWLSRRRRLGLLVV